ncbi:uncharacterized protein Z520_01412 [Fonsecaea multimorphosa CBS 102226]|uniref:Transcription factor domain-containing protein n=1 Tax=Fonsecaea multimorphosa CBS 102226 TaxID=1442371 RepID=A0A0D2J0S9_9EURO|nr:uncharacterized protein Z520_01412 [Fonsecaea multimorphosa CBS 102226]KIY02947.1 hypothetical protein Z520_01412 [Fonsecaea multimorphosa CBS 102226]OAL30779.1 hypothetical protein AYO22_01399 [Fonsecaea multimorphosa]
MNSKGRVIAATQPRSAVAVQMLNRPGRKPRAQKASLAKAANWIQDPISLSPRASPADAPTAHDNETGAQCWSLAMPQDLSVFGGLTPPEQQSLVVILDKDRFFERFVLGPTFQDDHFRAILTRLYTAMPLLKDAFLACAGISVNSPAAGTLRLNETYYYHKATSGLDTFRSFQITGAGDVSLYLSLALAVLTFNIHVVGGSAFRVCRYTLPALASLNDGHAEIDPDDFAFLICILHTELVGCLFRHEVPTFRFQIRPEDLMNRYLGLSVPLLSYGYDLCVLSIKLHQANEEDRQSLLMQLQSLEAKVSAWRPTYPADFLSRYSQGEVAHMLSQVQIFRQSLLLIAHRLQHPFGTCLDRSEALSDMILEQFDSICSLVNRMVVSMDFAFLVAAFEVHHAAKRKKVLDKVDLFRDLPVPYRTRLKSILCTFWQTVDENSGLHWFDLNLYLAPYLD